MRLTPNQDDGEIGDGHVAKRERAFRAFRERRGSGQRPLLVEKILGHPVDANLTMRSLKCPDLPNSRNAAR